MVILSSGEYKSLGRLECVFSFVCLTRWTLEKSVGIIFLPLAIEAFGLTACERAEPCLERAFLRVLCM
jgi:hypothetical protein